MVDIIGEESVERVAKLRGYRLAPAGFNMSNHGQDTSQSRYGHWRTKV